MSFLTRWFSKKEPEDFETVLSSLALDIQGRQTRLSEIRLRERRTSLAVTLYSFALWALYFSLWYTGLLPHMYGRLARNFRTVPVFLGPIAILFGRRIVQLWYARKGDAEEKVLKKLYKEQRDKIEEIKKKTNYYTTRSLLERYDEAPAAESPLRRRVVTGPAQIPSTPQRPGPQNRPPPGTPQNIAQSPIPPRLQTQLAPTPQQPLQPPRKQWYDKLADAILGEDEPSVNAAASRYALICQKCFAHNGLVKESMWEDARTWTFHLALFIVHTYNVSVSVVPHLEYVCPKCGHFNPSARSLRQPGLSPQSPRTPSAPAGSGRSSPSPSAGVRARAPSQLRQSASPESAGARDSNDAAEPVVEGSSMRMDVDS
ncbi:hypothetical protein EWM64_g3993 [Hericium alpestre]|uniref:Endoplasmic reticulum junction formation protein lunapark n=1 Tax=Hericium alpestre TaxID=135208 RepID=A0A4Z0A0R9_9AGAM|nr:hypothetical protein EWM64_g3993 [Hericium alpestre]